MDNFVALRRRVMRRCVFALNALALRDDRLPRDGAFDAAVANGLAAIVASESSGDELENKRTQGKRAENSRRVKSPLQLVETISQKQANWTSPIRAVVLASLKEGIEKAQPVRHGKADEEWDVLDEKHVEALVALDEHPALQVLDDLDGKSFAEAVTVLYWLETDRHYPADPWERSQIPEPACCDDCGRQTLVSEGFDAFGIGPGEGVCVACGLERTYEDTVADRLRWKIGDSK